MGPMILRVARHVSQRAHYISLVQHSNNVYTCWVEDNDLALDICRTIVYSSEAPPGGSAHRPRSCVKSNRYVIHKGAQDLRLCFRFSCGPLQTAGNKDERTIWLMFGPYRCVLDLEFEDVSNSKGRCLAVSGGILCSSCVPGQQIDWLSLTCNEWDCAFVSYLLHQNIFPPAHKHRVQTECRTCTLTKTIAVWRLQVIATYRKLTFVNAAVREQQMHCSKNDLRVCNNKD